MRNKINRKSVKTNSYLWHIAVIMAVCAVLYYLPVIAGAVVGVSLYDILSSFHNFYGIDFYALVFFAPVVYTAYIVGVKGALVTALISMFILLPYSILIDLYPNALFKPTAFVIILSAVGAVVAMLQKSDEQRRQSVKELKCLYGVGKAAEESDSIEHFLKAVVELIPQAMRYPEMTKVRITLRNHTFQSPDFQEYPDKIAEKLIATGEVVGTIEIHSPKKSTSARKQNHLVETLAERISGAVREIELEQSLKNYYQQLEEMVEKRTKDLEEVQDKLIRSERLAAVGELASGVGHELRNPLNVIRNCVYLLNMNLADKADEESMSTLRLLDKQIDIANRIVIDLLDFTRIKKPSLADIDLNKLVKESLTWVTVPENTAVIEDLDENSPQVKVDSEQVGRAFANVISNALQAMNGNGKLQVSTSTEDGLAWVKFEDNGCGIPEENLNRIFEPLFTTKPKGIGLGLAITKRLVEQNKGTIEVTSQVKKGTIFTIKLPIQKRR